MIRTRAGLLAAAVCAALVLLWLTPSYVKAKEDPSGWPVFDQNKPLSGVALCLDNLSRTDGGSKLEMIGGGALPYAVRAELNQMIAKTKKEGRNVGFVMVDIKTGRGVAYNADGMFYSASAVKGPYIISLSAKDPETVRTEEKNFKAIAVNSDNNAYSYVVGRYGTKCYDAWCKRAGADNKITRTPYTDFSADTLARLWLVSYDYFEKDPVGAAMGELFESPNYSVIRKSFRGRYRTRSKAGWIGQRAQAANDGGIVYAKKSPYVLVILSNYPGNLEKLQPYVSILDDIHTWILEMEGLYVNRNYDSAALHEMIDRRGFFSSAFSGEEKYKVKREYLKWYRENQMIYSSAKNAVGEDPG